MRRLAVLVALILAAGLFVAGARYQVVQAIEDRMSGNLTLGDATFAAPGLFDWPRLTQGAAVSSCDVCHDRGFPQTGVSAEYGVLRSDSRLTGVELPRLAWIVAWPPTCREVTPPGSTKCATYELVDDATGHVLDRGQVLP